MIQHTTIEEIVSAYIAEHHPDYYIVETAVHPGNRIVVELDSESGINIDDCVALTKHIESQLDREAEDFELEVGSAGLTSPLKVLRQYTSTIGQEVEVLRKGGIKEKGVLTAASPTEIQLLVSRLVRLEGKKRKTSVEETLLLTDWVLEAGARLVEVDSTDSTDRSDDTDHAGPGKRDDCAVLSWPIGAAARHHRVIRQH